MIDTILTQLRAALAFVEAERDNRLAEPASEARLESDALGAEADLRAAIAGVEKLMAERDDAIISAQECQSFVKVAIAERDALASPAAPVAAEEALQSWKDRAEKYQCERDAWKSSSITNSIAHSNALVALTRVIAERDAAITRVTAMREVLDWRRLKTFTRPDFSPASTNCAASPSTLRNEPND